MVYCGTNWSGWECGSCLGGDFDGYGEFFGGVEQGGKFYLTRLTFTPNAGFENSKHRTEHVELPNITKWDTGVEYKCVFVSGSQPGVGGGLTDMPSTDGFMWFQTNWVPVSNPDATPIAGLARVKLQTISESEYRSNPENHEFTLTHSWLVNDAEGNPEHWDSEDKLCHHYSNATVEFGGMRKKTISGPNHFGFYEKMQPTQTQNRLTYWEVGVADAVEVIASNPEVSSSSHTWELVDLDQYHFPLGLYMAKQDTTDPPADGFGGDELDPGDYTLGTDEYTSIAVYVKAAICSLPSLTAGTGDTSKILHDGAGTDIHADHSSLGEIGYRLATWSLYDSDPDPGVQNYRGVTYANARTYIKDFAVSMVSSVEDSGNMELALGGANDYRLSGIANPGTLRQFGMHYSWISVGRDAVGSGQAGSQSEHGNSADGATDGYKVLGVGLNSHLPSSGGPYEGGALSDYVSSLSTSAAATPKGSDAPQEDPDWTPSDDDTIDDKWTRGGNPGYSRVFGCIYPGSAVHTGWAYGGGYTNYNDPPRNIRPASLSNVDQQVYPSDYFEGQPGAVSFLESGFLVCEPLIAHSYMLGPNSTDEPGINDFGDPLRAGGRIVFQGGRYPLSNDDNQAEHWQNQDNNNPIDSGGVDYVGSPELPSSWNSNFPYLVDLDSSDVDEYRVSDCLYIDARGTEGTFSNPPDWFGDTFDPWNLGADNVNVSSHVADTGAAYAPRGTWMDSEGNLHHNGILSAGGPLITGLTR